MLWQPYFSDHRDLLSYVTIDWETVWGWHAQIEKCNQVSSWPMSVEVVSPCSLTDAVCESSLCWSLCFSSVLVNTAVVVRSIVWNTFVARASWSLFFLSQCLQVVCLLSASWADLSEISRYRHRCGAAQCDKHRELVNQWFFFIPHESESHRESYFIRTRDHCIL